MNKQALEHLKFSISWKYKNHTIICNHSVQTCTYVQIHVQLYVCMDMFYSSLNKSSCSCYNGFTFKKK